MEKQTMFWIGRLNIKMSLLLNLMYKFNTVPIRINFFPLLERVILMCMWKNKHENCQEYFEMEQQQRGLPY